MEKGKLELKIEDFVLIVLDGLGKKYKEPTIDYLEIIMSIGRIKDIPLEDKPLFTELALLVKDIIQEYRKQDLQYLQEVIKEFPTYYKIISDKLEEQK